MALMFWIFVLFLQQSLGPCEDSLLSNTGGNWHDADGAAYDCEWYASDDHCAEYGTSYANFGCTANVACCACGGGNGECHGCTSDSGWYDADGSAYNCVWYGSESDRCAGYGNQYENMGCTAAQACCECGGGDVECSAGVTDSTTTSEPTCAEGCKDAWLGDGLCDPGCNNPACNFDNGDCAQASTRCEWECGIPNALNENRRELIVGGDTSDPHEYPFMVLLRFNGGAACGGSIIDRLWVLTAAHCMHNTQASQWTVIAGEHNQFSTGSEITFAVSDVIIHPQYDDQTFDNDIALLRLSSSFPCDNPHIKPMCFASFGDLNLNGWLAWVVGWGRLETDGATSTELHEVMVEAFEVSRCAARSSLSINDLTGNMFCAGDFSNGGEDSCQGDSGGPIFIDINPTAEHKYIQIGIVSWGYGCAVHTYPGVYTRLPNYDNFLSKFTNATFVEMQVSQDYCAILMTEDDVFRAPWCHASCATCGFGSPGDENSCITCSDPHQTIDIRNLETCTGACVAPSHTIHSFTETQCQSRYSCVTEMYTMDSTPPVDECENIEPWLDESGNDCFHYTHNPTLCLTAESSDAYSECSPMQACCACGGGKTSTCRLTAEEIISFPDEYTVMIIAVVIAAGFAASYAVYRLITMSMNRDEVQMHQVVEMIQDDDLLSPDKMPIRKVRVNQVNSIEHNPEEISLALHFSPPNRPASPPPPPYSAALHYPNYPQCM